VVSLDATDSREKSQENQIMKSIFSLAILISLVPLAGARAEQSTNRLVLTPKFLSGIAEEARTNYPGMRAAEARLRAAEQGIRAVRAWDDPEVMFGGFIGNGVMRRDEGDLLYGVQQKLPINGKPQADRAVAAAARDVEETAREMRFQTLRKEIVQSLLRLALDDESARIFAVDQSWVETMVAATQERYKAGRSTQVEVLRMETEHAGRAENLRRTQRERDGEVLILNRLLGRPLETKWPDLALPDLWPQFEIDERVLRLAGRGEPRVRMLHQEVIRAEAAAEVARRAKRPDVSIGVEARQFAGDGEFKEGTAVIKMTIPFVNRSKYSAAYAREKDRAAAAELDAREYETQVRDDTLRLGIRIENARRQALLYRDQIIPRGEQTLASAESNWQSGRAFFHDVLDTRRLLLDARNEYAKAVAEQYAALSELVLCCGLSDFDALQNVQKNFEPQK
jgi:cobalt-zinc-cadmium efflux system outer membrane protein